MVSQAFKWILTDQTGFSLLLHYMNSLLFIAPAETGQCQLLVYRYTDLCYKLDVPLADDKAEGPTTDIAFSRV